MISIRRGKIQDVAKVSSLLLELSEEFIAAEFSETGKQNFLREFTAEKIAEKMSADNFRFHLAEDDGDLIGVVAVRDNTHLFYLFVAKSHQKRGVSRVLWERAKSESLPFNNSGVFTVNASNYAVKAYERLGFVLKGATQETKGVLYNPMEMNGGG